MLLCVEGFGLSCGKVGYKLMFIVIVKDWNGELCINGKWKVRLNIIIRLKKNIFYKFIFGSNLKISDRLLIVCVNINRLILKK